MFGRERYNGDISVVAVDQTKASVQITNPDSDGPPNCFTYDAAFDHTGTQREIYDQGVATAVAGVLNGKLKICKVYVSNNVFSIFMRRLHVRIYI